MEGLRRRVQLADISGLEPCSTAELVSWILIGFGFLQGRVEGMGVAVGQDVMAATVNTGELGQRVSSSQRVKMGGESTLQHVYTPLEGID